MFIDNVTVRVEAGDGGNGAVSFRQEKFIDRGGPDGGDGGNGGNVVFVATRNQHTLAAFRHHKVLKAKDGQAGSKRNKHGRRGDDLSVDVPIGTVVIDEDGAVLADLVLDGQKQIIAAGGKGGFGNAHFISSTRQAPRVAEKGEPGDALDVSLELKMIAEVGLIGLPNAGKSTLLSVISNARPEIAAYPFTTLRPNLGVVDIDGQNSLLFADIPGLIAGASQGKGLGDDFLRHVERTKVLVHLIDAYNEDIKTAYSTIQDELAAYKIDLRERPQVVVLSKTEGLGEKEIEKLQKALKKIVPKGTQIFAISAHKKTGVKELLYALKQIVDEHKIEEQELALEQIPVLQLAPEESWRVERTDRGFLVSGAKIEGFARRTDFENPAGIERLRDIMQKMGIMRELERQHIDPNTVIEIGTHGTITY